jgi:hypothetical protein
MKCLNARTAVLLTAFLLSMGIGSVGCDETLSGVGAAETVAQAEAKATYRSWPRLILPPPRR